ncbi:MAG TPA: PrsW family intramembrane metalloprotease [Longimicrobium sp.]|nr:PrsW family intramembrane metalloprotease [Longimicrobium sp.]
MDTATSVQPPLPAPRRSEPHRVLTWGAASCGVLSLLLIAADIGPAAFALGVAIAVVPVPVYVVLALWLDRFEPEPAWTLAQTFAWGATVAVFLALMVNGLLQVLLDGTWGVEVGEVIGSVFTAPIVEELAKGVALLFLFSELRDEFDGVVDGVVYASMVGLGFAMVENVQYYGQAVAEGTESSVLTFVLRGLMAPFAHPLFTSMFGIGLGMVREGHSKARGWLVAALGLAAAMGLHALWNLSASFEGWFLVLYLLVMVPAFVAVLWVVRTSLRREGRVIREHLAHLVHVGALPAGELDCLCQVRTRLRASATAFRHGGLRRWRARRELHRIASELAFHRWRTARGLSMGPEADAAREAEYMLRFSEICRMLELQGDAE